MNQASIDSAGADKKTFNSYATGFALSIVLTMIPFVLVMQSILTYQATLIAVFSAAIAQILVHLYYFLHLDASSEARWSILAMLFTLLIMLLFVGGTIWIMHHLNYRLM